MAVDGDRLNELLGRVIGDLGATTTAGGVVVGHRLGLYGALARGGPATPEDLAARTDTDARYVAEWLAGQAAGGYVEYDPPTGRFSMTPEQAFALADPDGPLYLPGAFVFALGALRAEPRITEAFRSGAGMGWHEHDDDVVLGCELLFRPGYVANLVAAWIPALDGVEDKLRRGGRVADVGCGVGASSVLLAQAFPEVRVSGSDYHAGSVELARKRAADAGVADRVTFEVASAQTFAGSGYDLVATFDCLHDMGDPLGAARRIRAAVADDGTWMVVEPRAGDRVADNLNPVGRAYYGFSTFVCVPNARSQPGGYSLGAQAGEAAVRQIATDAGFTRFRRVGADATEQRLRGTTVGGKSHAGTAAGHRRSDRTGRGAGRVRGVRAPGRGPGARPTLVLLTSWAIVHMRQWKFQVPALARRFRVVTVEGRGNGAADRPKHPAAYADRELVADAVAVMDAAGVDRAVLVGLSMGGRHALQLAAWYPDRAAGVVAVGTALPWPLPPGFDEVAGRATRAGRRRTGTTGSPTTAAGSSSSCRRCSASRTRPSSGRTASARAWRRMRRPCSTPSPGSSTPTDADAEAVCRAVRCPVLVVHGERDEIVPVRDRRPGGRVDRRHPRHRAGRRPRHADA